MMTDAKRTLGEDLPEVLEQVRTLLEGKDEEALAGYLGRFHPRDVADIVRELDEDERVTVLGRIPTGIASETLSEMETGEEREAILHALDPGRVAALLRELADDDAADLLGELEPETQARILGSLSPREAKELLALLRYAEESAGGIMTTELVAVPAHRNAADAIAEVRRQAREVGAEFYTVFVVDAQRRLLGTVSLRDLVVAEPSIPVDQITQPPLATVTADTDQEEVARIIGRYDLPSLAVVGPGNVLLGRITWDDVMDVLQEEQTEDILRLGGVDVEEELRGGWLEAVGSRLPWLFVNLLTAAAAAAVVYLFQATISRLVVLAAIMPVVAGMGGNAGTQALAVTVRRLALDPTGVDRWQVAGKELLAGLANGAALGIFVGVVGYLCWGDLTLGAVILMAMWGNLIVASCAGALVPILLDRLGADPAVASSIFVTTFTDVAGFFLLLGLATMLML